MADLRSEPWKHPDYGKTAAIPAGHDQLQRAVRGLQRLAA